MCKLAVSKSSGGRYTVCLLMPFVAVLTLQAPLLAQAATGRIAVLLEDPSGAIVRGGEIGPYEVGNYGSRGPLCFRRGTCGPIPGSETIDPGRARTSDTASLVGSLSGLDVYTSGGLSSVPVIHGMADDRVNMLVDGMSLAPACPMHMNPALSLAELAA